MNKTSRISEITKAGVYIENGVYYLAIEGQDRAGHISIPKINIDSFVLTQEDNIINGKILFARKVNIEMKVEADENGEYATYTQKTQPVKEMTLKEIQQELGYKVKIKE